MTGTQDAPGVVPGVGPGVAPGSAGPASRRPSPYAAELAHLLGPEAPGRAGAPDRRPVLDPQPGPVPLRPIGLGDVLDTALTIVRRAPGPTLGPGFVVAALALLVPTAVVALVDGLGGRLPRGDGASASIAALLGKWFWWPQQVRRHPLPVAWPKPPNEPVPAGAPETT